ncbi:helix-turn-helix domain-containing protein [Ideonella sp. A 288]|uniref:AraC family transcriptional regulator n=1 Tax=Ideonella sp. A 288 TaxID=1962181 RepID=UPI000B4BA4B8|nr:helix-turn-helix domain-containing protein [Ideonella sp. A 288]
MGYLEQVQKGVDFIEAHLDEEVSFQQIAQAAGLSAWHFQRIFKALTHETLKSYIRTRRLAQACAHLVTTRQRILDIALQAGFESQESFSRAFKKRHGLNPGEFRKAGRLRFEHQRVGIDLAYLAHLRAGVAPQPVVQTVPARMCVGLRTPFFGSASEKNNVAQRIPPLWDAFLIRLAEVPAQVPGTCFGLIEADGDDGEALAYCAAVEVTGLGALPPGMSVVHVPARTGARFRHIGPVANLDHTVDYIYSNWLLNAGWRHAGGADIEIYGEDYDPSSASCVTCYEIPVCRDMP